MKKTARNIGMLTLAIAASLSASAASQKVGMLIGYETVENENAQEATAAKWFQANYPQGVVITPSQLDKIDASELDALWVHIDRCGIGVGFDKLPAEFNNDDVMNALSEFVEDGGNLYLSKFATQMVAPLGRIPMEYQPGIFGDGDGGDGFDDWFLNAYLGSWQVNPDNQEQDPSQIYDRTSHVIYKDMLAFTAQEAGYPHPAFPMEGTGNPETSLHREDHNCMWDLNAYTFTTEGKNTLEKFESQFTCEVLGTWGHVQDYCVAGIVDFAPKGAIKGRILANGLAACEWAPRSGENKYHSNLETLTKNILEYLAPAKESGVTSVVADSESATAYYTLQGVKVERPVSGFYVKVVNGNASKVLVK